MIKQVTIGQTEKFKLPSNLSNFSNLSNLSNLIWIYKWNSDTQQFYCIPKNEGEDVARKQAVETPFVVNLSPNFGLKYNHLVIITRNLELFRIRVQQFFSRWIKEIYVVPRTTGHLIMKSLSAQEIIEGKNQGVAVLLYCGFKTRRLYNFFKYNYIPFYIEAMGSYQNAVQCFFDYKRRVMLDNFGSRGLFKINITKYGNKDDIEDCLEFITDNLSEMPPYKITAFDIETARIDEWPDKGKNVLPRGDTIYDRLCSVAFHTCSVFNGTDIREENDKSIVYLYTPKKVTVTDDTVCFPVIYCYSELELLIKVFRHFTQSEEIGIFLTGWNIINFDYVFLLKRALFHGVDINCILSPYQLNCMMSGTSVCDLAPPWTMSIDTMECRKRFFPRSLPINPPSNALNDTAKVLLSGGICDGKTDFHVSDINKIYQEGEGHVSSPFSFYTREKLQALVKYNLRDAQLVSRLNKVLEVVSSLVPLSQLADLDPGHCIHYNTTKVALTFMRNKFQSVQMAPIDYNLNNHHNNNNNDNNLNNKFDDIDIGKKGTYKGAMVLDPIKGIHMKKTNQTKQQQEQQEEQQEEHEQQKQQETVLGCLDFASLYPSIMIAYGILRGYVTKISLDDKLMLDKGEEYLNQHFKVFRMSEDPKHLYLSTRKPELTPIHYLCKSLIEKRALAKKNNSPTLANALKVMVNSLYGICGVKGILHDVISATMITGYGRCHLLKAKEYFEREKGMTILYGDTDSVFITGTIPGEKTMEQPINNNNNNNNNNDENKNSGNSNNDNYLDMLAQEYNQKLASEEGHSFIKLSSDGEFECIVFIRKKLYMAKLCSGKGYKMSGFPKRLTPEIHTIMTQTLCLIIETIIRVTNENTYNINSNLGVELEKVYCELFYKCINNQYNINSKKNKNNENEIERYSYPVKIKPLNSYKSKTSRQSYLAKMCNVEDDTYVSVLDLIPLIKNLPKKSLSLCLTRNYDTNLHTINKSANISQFLCKTFDPIIKVVLSNDKVKTLSIMSVEYKKSLQMESLFKYRKAGYQIYDFSNCKMGSKIKISMLESWPHFYEALINHDHPTNISWMKEEKKTESHEMHEFERNIFLKISFQQEYNISDCLFYPKVILPSAPPGLRNFKSLDELEKMLRILENGHILIKKLYLTLTIPFTEHVEISDVIKMFAFIYGKGLSQNEIGSFKSDMYLILLPFIAIKFYKGGKFEFCYY